MVWIWHVPAKAHGIIFFLPSFFLGVIGVWTQGFISTKQALYHTSRPCLFLLCVCVWYWGLNSGPSPWATPPVLFLFFKIGSHGTTCLSWLWTDSLLVSASWVARITCVSHQYPVLVYFLRKDLTMWPMVVSNKWSSSFGLSSTVFCFFVVLGMESRASHV
jgi:hypothetical protein